MTNALTILACLLAVFALGPAALRNARDCGKRLYARAKAATLKTSDLLAGRPAIWAAVGFLACLMLFKGPALLNLDWKWPTWLPTVAPVSTPTAVVYIHEKDSGGVPSGVLAALDKLNRQGLTATAFEEDALDGSGQVPEQYRISLPAAREAGLPALVVMSGQEVLRVVKSPVTEEQVLEAAR